MIVQADPDNSKQLFLCFPRSRQFAIACQKNEWCILRRPPGVQGRPPHITVRRCGGFKDSMAFESIRRPFPSSPNTPEDRIIHQTSISSTSVVSTLQKIIPAIPGQNWDITSFSTQILPEQNQQPTETSLEYSPNTPNSISGQYRNHLGVKSLQAPTPIK